LPLREEYRHLSALKNGDENSFKWVYAKYFQVIFVYCKKLIGIEVLAEEATSEVFITLWKKRAIINTDQSVQAFLYRIAKFKAYDCLKKIATDKQLQEQFLLSHSTSDFKNGERLLIEKEQLEAINRLVETLPPQRKTIFKMRYFEGLDNMTIAKQLKISSNTVKVHLVKARQHLKQHLSFFNDLYLPPLLILGFILQ